MIMAITIHGYFVASLSKVFITLHFFTRFANQAYRYTRKFSIKWNGSRAENSELSILKDGETPLESIPFDIEQQVRLQILQKLQRMLT